MVRIVLGVVAGFFAWAIVWFGSEKILSAIWPEGFGAHQRAFEEAVKNGGQFTADTKMLLTHIVLGSIVSVMSGSLAAVIAGENKRAPLVLGFLLVAVGLLKVVMSWPYVPIWYHVILRRFYFQWRLWAVKQVGLDIETSAVCIAVLWFGQTRQNWMEFR